MAAESYIHNLFNKHRKNGILVDTSLMLLSVIGDADIELIEKFKRTKIYTADDYQLLKSVYRYFDKIICTPNILTEVSNFIGQLPEKQKEDVYRVLSDSIKIIDEFYIPSLKASSTSWYRRFGLTDSVLRELASSSYLLISDDLVLVNSLHKNGIDAININHLRGQILFS